jgi:hypothetical protein
VVGQPWQESRGRTAETRQPGLDIRDRTDRKEELELRQDSHGQDIPDRAAGTGMSGKVSLYRTGRTGWLEQGQFNWHRITGTAWETVAEKPERDSWVRTTGRFGTVTTATRQPGKVTHDRAVQTGQLEEDSLKRTAGTSQPGQVSQIRLEKSS